MTDQQPVVADDKKPSRNVHLYSASNRGFFSRAIHKTLPDDAVELTDAQYLDLRDSQSRGMVIEPDKDGKPTTVPRAQETLTVAQRGQRILVERDQAVMAVQGEIDQARDDKDLGQPMAATQFQALIQYKRQLLAIEKDPAFPNVALPRHP
jgi:hypothetical protein